MVSAPHSPAALALFARLDALGVAHETYIHEPVFTVAQGKHMKAQWPGAHSKNLFLKDKRGTLALVAARDETTIDLKALANMLPMGRPSFGSADLMEEALGVTPGSVTVFALGHAGAKRLDHVVIDAALLTEPRVHFHPLANTATTAISPEGLLAFVRDCGFAPRIIDFSTPEAPRDRPQFP